MRKDLFGARQRRLLVSTKRLSMKRLFVLAVLMLAFATAPAFAEGCGSHIDTTETEKSTPATGA